jgi:hypothetical protein
MNNCIIILKMCFLLVFQNPCKASSWTVSSADEISLTTNEGKIVVKVWRGSDKEIVKMNVKIDGKEVAIKEEYLFGVGDFDSRTVAVLVERGPEEFSYEKMADSRFCISFAFGANRFHGVDKEGERVKVRSRIRVYFENGKARYSEMAVPTGDYVNKWEFREFPADEDASPYFEERVQVNWSEAK